MDEDLGFVPEQSGQDDLGFVAETPWKDAAVGALGSVRDTMMAPYKLAQALREDPKELNRKVGPWLPAAGGAIGTAFAPATGGVSIPVGAGLGEIMRQAGDIAFEEPGRQLAGENFSPKAGLQAATQTALAGAPEVSGIFKAAPGAKPYLQRGIEATGKFLAPVGDAIKRGAARATEVMTGVPARSGVKLIEEPGRLVSGIGKTKKLGQAVDEAEESLASSLEGAPSSEPYSEGVRNYAKEMYGVDLPSGTGMKWGPELDAAITTNKGGIADTIVNDLLVKAKKTPGAITVDEALAGVKSIDRTFPNYTAKNGKIIQKYSDLRTTLSDILSTADPKLAAAKGAYSDAMVGGAFRHPFRQTKTGQTSAVPFISFLVSPSNWSAKELGSQALKLPLFSPAAYGTAMAAGSAGAKAVGTAITNPTARQTLISRYITSRNEKGKK